MRNILVKPDVICSSRHIIVEYYLCSKTTLFDAAYALATGQSYGNPQVISCHETEEKVEKHCAKIVDFGEDLKKYKEGQVTIAFPTCNFDFENEGISQILCAIMGGQLDIDIFNKCHVLDINIPGHIKNLFPGSRKHSINAIRQFTQVFSKPLLGGIIKPKTGFDIKEYVNIIEELCVGGCNFIKEDEIISSPRFFPLKARVVVAQRVLKDFPHVIFAHCINADPHLVLENARMVFGEGGNAVHVNFWCGLGVYNSIANSFPEPFLFFQKSGDKILTEPTHRFHIKFKVICELAAISGIDFIHAGMLGGYLDSDEEEFFDSLSVLRRYEVMPSLSCGFHPGLVDYVTDKVGVNYLANCGGSIHGHPGGTLSGAKAMKQAIDKNYSEEYKQAIEKWGYIYKDNSR